MAAKPDYDVSKWADGLDVLSADELHGTLQGYKKALETLETTGLSPHRLSPTVDIVGVPAFIPTIASYADRADNVGEAALGILHLFLALGSPPEPVLDILLTSPHTAVCAAYLGTYFFCGPVDASARARLCVANTDFMDRLVASLRDSGKGQVLVEELAHIDDHTRAALLNYPGLVEALFSVLSSGMESRAAACALQQMPNDIALGALCLPETRVPVFLAAIGASLGTNDGVSVKLLRWLAVDEGIRKQIHDDNFVVTELARLLGKLPPRKGDDEEENEPVVVLFEICAVEPIPSHELVGKGPAGCEGDILDYLCSRPFHHHVTLAKAMIREYPDVLNMKDGGGLTLLDKARTLPRGSMREIVPLLLECVTAIACGHSLQHIVGYRNSGGSERQAVSHKRSVVMLCLKTLGTNFVAAGDEMAAAAAAEGGESVVLAAGAPADQMEVDAPDVFGELAVNKAVRAYIVCADVWQHICEFAF
ncbi:hypothetical protein TeGR_g13896 [Tetraparma gracilis]|uniref:Uncharacterized protein n=1 Tax=Tetraparma gracilis TaxID=2962635 RepID=A0ABQ6MJ34_9STRA|nr:hypothetical protein TeGR_g13896 [Tetraparma gracilis]